MLKGQDIVIIAALMKNEARQETYAELGKRTFISASETFASIKRLQGSALMSSGRRLLRRNALEFLLHGLRYAFPLLPSGGLGRGMPTSYAAPVAEGEFAITGNLPVWNTSRGLISGVAFEPLYPTAPQAASADRDLYDRLAVLDMLRGGRIRERLFAEAKLREYLT